MKSSEGMKITLMQFKGKIMLLFLLESLTSSSNKLIWEGNLIHILPVHNCLWDMISLQ